MLLATACWLAPRRCGEQESRAWACVWALMRPDGVPFFMQVPLSKVEPEEYINDRYKAIEDRLKVCCW